MPTASRNDPCPCGSGRKYKKCCALREAPAAGWTPEEREAAFAALFHFLRKPMWDELYEEGWSLFWPDELDDLDVPGDEIDRLVEDPDNQARFLLWLALDRIDPEGPRPVDVFLDRERHRLASGSRIFIERLAAAPMRLYQILRVDTGVGIELRDLLDRTTRFVHERLGTQQFVQWDLIAARLMLNGEGQTVIDGSPYLLNAGDKPQLLKHLKRIRRHLAKEGFEADALFDTHAAVLFHHMWLSRVALRQTPVVVGPDGEPLVLGKAVYRVTNSSAFRTWIATQAGVEPEPEDDAAWAWVPDRPSDDARLVATLKLGPKRMIAMTFSRAALARTREWLRQAPTGVLAELFTREFDPQTDKGPAKRPLQVAPEPSIDPAVEAQVVGEFLENHYRDWPDIALPALGGLTPREAARDTRRRGELRALLQEMESHSARDRRAGRPAYDFTWMWAELGLRR